MARRRTVRLPAIQKDGKENSGKALPPAAPLAPREKTKELSALRGPKARHPKAKTESGRYSASYDASFRAPRRRTVRQQVVTNELKPDAVVGGGNALTPGFARPRSARNGLEPIGAKTEKNPAIPTRLVRPARSISMPRPTPAGSRRMQKLAREGRLKPPANATTIIPEDDAPPLFLPPVS